MKTFLIILTLLLALGARAADRITATVTITNTPSNGDYLSLNGDNRTWKTSATNPASWIQISGSIGANLTNLYNQIAAYPFAGAVSLTQSGTNKIVLTGQPGSAMSVIFAGTWGYYALSTQAVTSMLTVRVPVSGEPTASVRTNIGTGLVDAIGVYSTNKWAESATALTHFVGTTSTQSISNKTSYLSVFNGGTITNSTLQTTVIPYRTNDNGIYFKRDVGSVEFTMAPDSTGWPSLYNISGGLTVLTNAADQVAYPASILNANAGDHRYGRLTNVNAWTGTNSFTQITNSAITGSTISGSTIGGTLSTVSSGTISGSTITNGTYYGTVGLISGGYANGMGLTNSLITNSVTKINFDVAGDLALRRYTITSLTSSNNAGINFGTNTFVSITTGPSAAFNICGITGGRDGKLYVIYNNTAHTMTIAHASGVESTPENRILTQTSEDMAYGQKAVVILIYDSSQSRWVTITPPGDIAGIVEVDTIPDMLALDPTRYRQLAVHGYHTVTDGGGGLFYSAQDDGSSTNLGTVFRFTGNTNYLARRLLFSPEINVRWFGAAGNDIADDTSAMRAALAMAGGNSLFVPVGTYLLSGTLTNNVSGTRIYGVGVSSVMHFTNVNACVNIPTVRDMTIEQLKFCGPARQGIYVTSSTNVVIKDCTFTQFTLESDGTTNTASYTAPIRLALGANILIERNDFYGNGYTNASHLNSAVDIMISPGAPVAGLTIAKNTIVESLVSLPMALFDAVHTSVTDNFINQGNWGTNSTTGYGILAYQSTNTIRTYDVIISRNVVTNTAGSGIYTIALDGVTVEGNHIFNASQQQNAVSVPSGGIVVGSGSNCRIANNTVKTSGQSGIVFGSGITNGVMTGNIVSEIAYDGYQIRGSESFYNVVMSMNVSSNAAQFGIYLNPIVDCVLNGNIVANSLYGIVAVDAVGSKFTGNDIINCPFNGIIVQAGHNNTIMDNTLFSATNVATSGMVNSGNTSQIAMNKIDGYATKINDAGTGNHVFELGARGTTGRIVKWNGTPTLGESALFDTGSSVGLGTTNPVGLLELSGGVTGYTPFLTLSEAGNNGANSMGIDWKFAGLSGFPFGVTARVEAERQGVSSNFHLVFSAATNGAAFQVARITHKGLFDVTNGVTVAGAAGSGSYMRGDGAKAFLTGLLLNDGTDVLGASRGGTGTGTGFTAGSVVFAGASGVYGQDNTNLFWDDTNNRLGIGTATPAANLDSMATTEQLRLSYNAGNKASLTVSSGGDLAIAPSGGTMNVTGNIIGSGVVFSGGSVRVPLSSYFYWNAGCQLLCTADGLIRLLNDAGTGFTALQFGGATASFPEIKRNGTALNFRLADDSADAPITASGLTLSGDLAVNGGDITTASGNLTIAPSGSQVNVTGSLGTSTYISAGTHLLTSAAGAIYWNTRTLMYCPSDGNLLIQNNAATDFGRMQFGGTTASFPSLKRSGSALQVRLADDSGDASITASSATLSSALSVLSSYANLPGLTYVNNESETAWPILGKRSNLLLNGTTLKGGTIARSVTGGAAWIGTDTAPITIEANGANPYEIVTTVASATATWEITGVSLQVPSNATYVPYVITRLASSASLVSHLKYEVQKTDLSWLTLFDGTPPWINNTLWKGSIVNADAYYPIKGVRVTFTFNATDTFYLTEIGIQNPNIVVNSQAFAQVGQANTFYGSQKLLNGLTVGSSGDVGFNRSSAGVVKITDGGAGSGSLLAAGATFSGLTASRFVQTDGSKNLVSYDLFGSANTFSGLQTFQNSGDAISIDYDATYRTRLKTTSAGELTITNTGAKVNVGGNLNVSGLTASTLLRADGSKNLAAVTVGSGLTFDGTTLSATASGTAGTVINTGASTTNAIPVYSDTTGTNVVPKTLTEGANISITRNATTVTVAATGLQPLDSDLTAVAGLASNGLIARTGTGTMATRTITAGSSKITMTNGDGVSGNPTVDVAEANLDSSLIPGTVFVKSVTGIECNTTNTVYTIFTTAGSGRYIMTGVDLECTALTPGGNSPQFMIYGGSNALMLMGPVSTREFNNVYEYAHHDSDLTASGGGGTAKSVATGTAIKFELTTPSTDSTTVSVYVRGFYR